MEVAIDGCSDKRKILKELARCLKTVFVEASGSKDSTVQLEVSSPLINGIDRSLQHGLLNLLHSYWPLVRSYSHAQTLQSVDLWVGTHSSSRLKGQAWLLATLVEGSLLSYLNCILAEPQSIAHHYAPHAILRDPAYMTQLSSLLTGLESINFIADTAIFSNCDSNSCSGREEDVSVNLRGMLALPLSNVNGLQGTVMTSSMTSSLASPGDSGFTQLDSETDTGSFSEVALDGDSTSVREDVAVLPVDPCTEKTIGSLSIPAKDVTNANNSSGVMESTVQLLTDSDNVVFRRQNSNTRRSSDSKQQKRVSFHECLSNEPSHHVETSTPSQEVGRFSSSFRESTSYLSRAVGDFSSFDSEQEGVEIAGDSSLLGNDGIEELSAKNIFCSHLSSDHSDLEAVMWCERKKGEIMQNKTPVAERGIPEGQEDPPKRWSLSVPTTNQVSVGVCEQSVGSINSSPAPSCSSLRAQVSTPKKLLHGSNGILTGSQATNVPSILNQTASKACLVNRFLRSITEKKISNRRSAAALAALNKKKSSFRTLSLHVCGAKPSDELSQELLIELGEELNDFMLKSPHSHSHIHTFMVNVEPSLNCLLSSQLQLPIGETIFKVLKVRDSILNCNGERLPLLAIMSDEALYVLNHVLKSHAVLPYSDISFVVVGPNYQWLSFICQDRAMKVNFVCGERDLAAELVGGIEMMLRGRGIKSHLLPAVVHLLYEEFFRIPQWTSILQREEVHHYAVVHTQEVFSNSTSLPSEPILRSHFMFRTVQKNRNSAWEPGFFILREGLLHIASNEEAIIPLLSIGLQGLPSRLATDSSRPHTIEVGNLQIAAPDNYVAQDWLFALQRPFSEMLDSATSQQKSNITSSSILLTESRIILMRSIGIPGEDLDKLGKPYLTALLSDVTAVWTGGKKSTWCLLEFSCREVHDSGGDYVVFFSTPREMVAFKESLWLLCPQLVKETKVMSEFESLHLRCNLTAANLSSDWDFKAAGKQ